MHRIANIDILGDASLQRRVGTLSRALLILTALAALVAALLGGEPITLGWFAALVVGSIAALPVHELVHAAAFKLLCSPCRVRFGFEGCFLYTATDGVVATRARMVAVLLAPSLVVTAALAAIALAGARPALAIALSGIHLSGCAGDLLMAYAALAESACTHVRDTGVGIDLLHDEEVS